MTPITKNTNLQDEDQLYQTKGNLNNTLNNSNTYKLVMKRRKSRQSTNAPNTVDIDYAGDSGKFTHLMGKRGSLMAGDIPNTTQLNYEMKLRTYRNITDF